MAYIVLACIVMASRAPSRFRPYVHAYMQAHAHVWHYRRRPVSGLAPRAHTHAGMPCGHARARIRARAGICIPWAHKVNRRVHFSFKWSMTKMSAGWQAFIFVLGNLIFCNLDDDMCVAGGPSDEVAPDVVARLDDCHLSRLDGCHLSRLDGCHLSRLDGCQLSHLPLR